MSSATAWRARAAPRRARTREWLAGLARRVPCDAHGQARVGRRHIYILPTGFGVVLGGALSLMLLGSLNYQNNLGLLFTFLMGSVALVGMHHTWFNLLGLKVSARGGSPVFAGQDAAFGVTLSQDTSRRRPDLGVRAAGERTAPVGLEPGGSVTVGIRLGTRRRGVQQLKFVEVETRYPLGLFRAWCYARTDARVLVYPKPAARGPVPALAPAYRPSAAGDLGVGADEFVGPRDYRPGDSPRRLDWKALARERGLVVKQFGGDRAAQIWLDWSHLPAVETEARLSLLCRQVLDAEEAGLTYGLRLPERTVPMGHGDAHKHRCLEALANFGHD
jgi:uncharacterized protein (DUF58 family)